MWHERKMPARWYKLLRERMQVEEQRMRVIKDGFVIKNDRLQGLLTDAHNLDREMLEVMRQAIAEVLALEEVPRPNRHDAGRPASRSSRRQDLNHAPLDQVE